MSEEIKQEKKKITKTQAYKLWEDWLKKCPVTWQEVGHPTSFMNSINFDFTTYRSEEKQ